ncbi:MAG: copper resistance protein B [Paracoccaceae bacterium]|jgi:copper resistance protein B
MTLRAALIAALAPALIAGPAMAEQLIWGVALKQLEQRFGNDSDATAWKLDAVVGRDELKLRILSSGEYVEGDGLEKFETEALLQVPISDFFDAKAGIRHDAPRGPDRTYATIGVQGLAKQWFEVDLDAYLSTKGDLSMRLDADYEALITNRIILTPELGVALPFTDDAEIGVGAWGPTIEVGARLSYDLIDRTVSPYVGVLYERAFGATADLRRADGEAADALFVVVGARIMF